MTEYLIPALQIVFTPYSLLVIFAGALFGIFCGAMPGLSAIMAMTILMPASCTFRIASVADCGTRWVSKLTSVPSTSKNMARTLSVIHFSITNV